MQLGLPVKIVLLKNDSLAEVKFEQRDLGNPEFGCALSPIDFVAYAKACGAGGRVRPISIPARSLKHHS